MQQSKVLTMANSKMYIQTVVRLVKMNCWIKQFEIMQCSPQLQHAVKSDKRQLCSKKTPPNYVKNMWNSLWYPEENLPALMSLRIFLI